MRLDELPAQRAARGTRVVDFEFSIVFDDSTTRHVLGYGTPLLNAEGQTRGAVHVLVDITERKLALSELARYREQLETLVEARTGELRKINRDLQMEISERKQIEERLRESELRLEYALQAGELGVWDLDLKSGIAWRSLRHDQIFGYETLLQQWNLDMFMEHTLPEYRPEVSRMLQQTASIGTGWSFECRIRRADGVVRWIWAKGKPCCFEGNQAVRVIGIVRDITLQKEAENESRRLRQSEDRLSMVLEHVGQGVIVANEAGEVIYWNPAARKMHGVAPPR